MFRSLANLCCCERMKRKQAGASGAKHYVINGLVRFSNEQLFAA